MEYPWWVWALAISALIFVLWLFYRDTFFGQLQKEKRIIKYYQKQMLTPVGTNGKEVTTIEIGSDSNVRCPYCNGRFSSSLSSCPSCGANVTQVDDKIVITKVDTHSEIYKILSKDHELEMAKIQAKRDQQKYIHRENMMLVPLLVIAVLVFIIVIVRSVV